MQRPNISDFLDLEPNFEQTSTNNYSPYKTYQNSYKEDFLQPRKVPRNLPVYQNMVRNPDIMKINHSQTFNENPLNEPHMEPQITPIHLLEGFKKSQHTPISELNLEDSNDIMSNKSKLKTSSKGRSNEKSNENSNEKSNEKSNENSHVHTCSSPCVHIMNHINECPVCKKMYNTNNNNSYIYIIVIVLLVLFIMLLLKKIMNI